MEEMDFQSMDSGAAGIWGGVVLVIYLAVFILVIAGMWKIFTKAGKPGWAAIVPIYNIIVLLEVTGKPIWWIILFLIPVVGYPIMWIVVLHQLSLSFGQGVGTTIGLFFLPIIFFPILGFGSAKYVGAGGKLATASVSA